MTSNIQPVSMDAQDERLRQLLKQVLQSHVGSLERASALNDLLALIPRLPGIRRDTHPDYLEALNEALRQVEQNIHKQFKLNSDLESATILRQRFVKWVNSYLKYRILDLYRVQNRPLSLDTPIGESGKTFIDILTNEGFTVPTLDTIDSLIESEQKQRTRRKVEALELYIEQDPDNNLRGCHPASCPGCNCQTLVKELFLNAPGSEVTAKEGSKKVIIARAEKKVTVRDIASRFGIKEQTIHTHWKRKCQPLLREFVNKFEQSIQV